MISHGSEGPSSRDFQRVNAADGEGNREPSYTVGGAVNGWVQPGRKMFGGSLKHKMESYRFSSNPTPCFYLGKDRIQKGTCTPIFRAALVLTAKTEH